MPEKSKDCSKLFRTKTLLVEDLVEAHCRVRFTVVRRWVASHSLSVTLNPKTLSSKHLAKEENSTGILVHLYLNYIEM